MTEPGKREENQHDWPALVRLAHRLGPNVAP